MMFDKLPAHNIWDSVRTEKPVARVFRPFCKHANTTKFIRTDHRTGAGWMSDSYEGTVCCDCGKVINQIKVY